MKTTLQIWRDGRQHEEDLLSGDAGVLQELRYAARFVREDSRKADVRRFVNDTILKGVRPFDEQGYVDAAFRYAQRDIIWRPDPVDIERLPDFWTTLYGLEDAPDEHKPEGDCLCKVVVMCTALGSFGIRPYFCVIQQHPSQPTFAHILVAGRFRDGREWHRDPTPEETPPDFQARFVRRAYYEIFPR
jgi:hypothetical protein